MKNTFFLTKIAQSMLIAGMALGITGAAYAQSGAGGAGGAGGVGGAGGAGAAVGGSAGISAGAAAGQAGIGGAGQAGSEMSGMSGALPGLGKDSPRSERAVPGLKSSAEPQGIPAAGPDIPPGKKSTSRASSRMKGSDVVGGE